MYIFSRQFIEELPQRFTGPGRLRFILQPITAILLGIRGGLADAKAGNPPYLFGLLSGSGRRKELLQSGVAAIRNLLAAGIIMDVVFQLIILPLGSIRGQPRWSGRFSFARHTTLSRALTNPCSTRDEREVEELSHCQAFDSLSKKLRSEQASS